MAISIIINGTSTQDETAGLQTLASPDADNDVSIASLPSFFSNRLFSQLGLSAAFATAVGVGDSAADLINVDAEGPLTSLGLTQANGDSFDGTQTTGLFTTDGDEIFLLSDSNNQIVLGVTAGGDVVFAVYMETSLALDGSTNIEMWTVTFEAIDHPDNTSYDEPVDIFENVYLTATGSLTFDFDALPSGSNLFGVVGASPDDSAIIVIGKNPVFNADGNYTNASDVIHTSQGGGPTTIGVNNQMFDPGDGAYFTYVNNPVGNYLSGYTDGLSPTEADDADNIQYTGGTLDAEGAFLKISQIQGNSAATMRLTAFFMPDDYQGRDFANNLGDGAQINITTVKVYNAAGTLIEDTSDLAHYNSASIVVTFLNGTATVSGLLANYRVEWETDGNHNQVLVEGVAGKFDIGLFGLTQGDFQATNLADTLFVEDDGPTITATATGAEVRHDETPGVQADTDVPGTDNAYGANTIAALFTNVPSPGDDLDVAGTGAIGFARSTTSPVVVTGGSAGTDGPAAQELSYALSVVNGTYSGVSTTGGTQIFMYNGTGAAAGLVLGRVGTEAGGTDTANASGTVAFALAVNPASGEVFLAQYLSLLHPTGGSSFDETITLAQGAVQLSVSRTDGDGDVATDSDNNIGLLIKFDDDGPTITATPSGTASVRHDETEGVQADTDVPGTDNAYGANTIASLFTNVPSPGDDPDVTGTGAIGFARSTNPLVTVTGGDAGADGPAAQELSYALSVANGTYSGVSTTGGTQIFLYNGTGTAAGLILGRVGTEAGGTDTANASGTVAFALAVNSASGEVFLAQYLSLLHGNTGSFDETITLADGAVQMSVSRTDGDGDVATDSDNNIGLLIKFDDDGPSITAEANTSASVVHDETTGVQADTDDPGSDNAYGANTIAALFANVPDKGSDPDVAVKDNGAIGFARSSASLVTVTGGSFGADGPGTVSVNYALGVTDGTYSGVSITEGTQIFLYNGTGAAAGLILGRVGTEAGATDTANASGTVAFALAINPGTGEVFVAQYLTLLHTDTGSTDEASASLIDSAVQVVVTRTDGDGDSIQSAPVNIGGLISFQDGGPEPVPAAQDVDPLVVDDTSIPVSDQVLTSDLFNAPDFNEDGPGTIGFALQLSAPNADSGLDDTLTGKNILFVTEAGTGDIVGYVDEDGLNGIGAGETLEALRYHYDNKGTSDTSDDEVIFTQSRSVVHPDATDPDEADFPRQVAANTVLLVRTITDGDGDPVTDNFDLGAISFIKDDGPSNFTPADILEADAVQNQPGESATKDLTGSNLTTVVADHSGKDGFDSIAFAGTNGSLLQGTIDAGSVQNLTSDSNPIYLYGFGTGTLVATTDSVDPTDQTDWVFTISLNSGTDSYTFNMLGQIDNGADSLFLDFAGQKQTNYEWLTLDLPETDPGDVDGNNDGLITGAEADGDILFTGMLRTAIEGGITTGPGVDARVTVSTQGLGVNSQSVNPLEGIFIDFVDGAPRTLTGQDPISALDFDNHFTVNNAGFAISQVKPTNGNVDVRVSVYNETSADPADSAAEIINDPQLDIVAITVRNGDGSSSFTFLADGSTSIGGRTISVDFNPANAPVVGANDGLHDYFAEIDNLGADYQVLIETASGYERILVENSDPLDAHGHISNEGFDISGIIIEQFDAGDTVNMNFDLTLLDGDLDSASGSFAVTLTPPDQII